MSSPYQPEDLDRLLPKERIFIDSIEDKGKRDAVACSLIQHRLPDTLSVGDPLPDLTLPRLTGGDPLALRSLAGDRPLL